MLLTELKVIALLATTLLADFMTSLHVEISVNGCDETSERCVMWMHPGPACYLICVNLFRKRESERIWPLKHLSY